jgi:SecD/SecF fusion protein
VIGILTTLFTAIFITRIIITNRLSKNKEVSFFFSFTKNLMTRVNFDFIGARKWAYVVSGTVIIATIISLFVNGLNFGVDFKGGRTYVVKLDQPVHVDKITNVLQNAFGEAPEVKTYGSNEQFKVITKYMVGSSDVNADNLAEQKLYEGLIAGKYLNESITNELFVGGYVKAKDGTYRATVDKDEPNSVLGLRSSQKVGPTIADDIKVGALWAFFLAMAGIFLYIFVRFRSWQYGLGGVFALFHDAIFVIGFYSMFYKIMPFSLEVNQAFIAAILTVVGYSINDSVIIYDRIREWIGIGKSGDKKELFNGALNSTLGRTINTVGTVLVTLLAILFFGGESLRGFIFALTIGVVVGTYSSIFISAAVVYDTYKLKGKQIFADKKKSREYLGGKKKELTDEPEVE